eukprot:1158957-Pelagomonas_calceolata.AAC.3
MPAKLVANVSTAPATASTTTLTLQGCQAIFFGRLVKPKFQGCPGSQVCFRAAVLVDRDEEVNEEVRSRTGV